MDLDLMRAIAAHRTGWADDLTRAVMDLGTTPLGMAVLALVLLALTVVRRGYRVAAASLVALVAAAVVARVLKDLIDRPRPSGVLTMVSATGPSMPSTHAALTSAAAAALLVATRWSTARTRRRATLLLSAGVVLVGVCLVYLGSHWPTDVLAGWALGVPIGLASGLALRRLPRTFTADA